MLSQRRTLDALHVLNDGFYASFLLFLPFLTKSFGLSLTQAGLLGTIVNSLGVLCALPSGPLAARVGGMRLLILSMLLYGAGYAGMSLAPSAPWLFPVFVAAGIGFALFHPVAFALVARGVPAQERGARMGNFTAIGDIGKMGISAALTVIVAAAGWRSAALLYGIIAIAFGLVFLATHRRSDGPAAAPEHAAPLRVREILAHPRFVWVSLTSFLDVFSSASLFVFLPFLLLAHGIPAALLGSFSAVFFVGSLLGKAALGRFSDRLGNAAVVIVAELLMALCIVVLAGALSPLVIIAASVAVGIFTKGTVPVIQTMIAEASEHHGRFERSFAVSGFINAIGLTLAPVLLGSVSDRWGIAAAFYAMAGTASLAALPALFFRITRAQ